MRVEASGVLAGKKDLFLDSVEFPEEATIVASLQKLTTSPDGLEIYRIAAIGPPGEHYLASQTVDLAAGPYTLSLDVRADGTRHIRVQLLDIQSNGAIGDYDLAKRSFATQRAGAAGDLRSDLQEVGNGWYRLWLGATLPGGKTRILLGLNDANGKPNFAPQGEGYRVRAIQLERGQSPNNLIGQSASWDQFIAATSTASLVAASISEGELHECRVAAIGEPGEHYLISRTVELDAGSYVLSLDVRPDGTSHIRVQVLDIQSNGVIGDFDLIKKTFETLGAGTARDLCADLKEVGKGWYRLGLAATLPGGNTRILLGLNDANGKPNFAPRGEGYQVRAIRLERGQARNHHRGNSD